MKKLTSLCTVAAMTCSLAGCSLVKNPMVKQAHTEGPYYTSTNDVSVKSIEEMTSPAKMAEYKGGVVLSYSYDAPGTEGAGGYNETSADDATTEEEVSGYQSQVIYLKEGDTIHVNELMDYSDTEYSYVYFSNDKDDPYIYFKDNISAERSDFSTEDASAIIDHSIYGFQFMDSELVSIVEADGLYIAEVEFSLNGTSEYTTIFSIDPVSGYVTDSDTVYYVESAESSYEHIQMTFSSDVTIDFSPKLDAGTDVNFSGHKPDGSSDETEDLEHETDTEVTVDGKLSFTTEDIHGTPISDEILKDAKVVMVNYWEPWCAPCVTEMPDLEKLYKNYKDQGLLILGVYSSEDMDDEIKQVMADCQTTYPILRADAGLEQFMTDSVPTTVFTDAEGNLLSPHPVVGSNDYAGWVKIIEGYLNQK